MDNVIQIKNLIYCIRGYRVMLDSDLAALYGVETKNLNKAVKRNIERFPQNFMFQLTEQEWKDLRFQIGTSNKVGGRRYFPYAFTEQGVAMLSSVLKSKQAIQINIQIMNTFVQIRQFAIENKELSHRLKELEQQFLKHCENNTHETEETMQHLAKIYEAIGLLMDRTKPNKIGFITDDN